MVLTATCVASITLPCAPAGTVQHLPAPLHFVRFLGTRTRPSGRIFPPFLGFPKSRPSSIRQIPPFRFHIPIPYCEDILSRRSTAGSKQSAQLCGHSREIQRPLNTGQPRGAFRRGKEPHFECTRSTQNCPDRPLQQLPVPPPYAARNRIQWGYSPWSDPRGYIAKSWSLVGKHGQVRLVGHNCAMSPRLSPHPLPAERRRRLRQGKPVAQRYP